MRTGNRKLGDAVQGYGGRLGRGMKGREYGEDGKGRTAHVCCPQRGPSETFPRPIIHMLCLNTICETLADVDCIPDVRCTSNAQRIDTRVAKLEVLT